MKNTDARDGLSDIRRSKRITALATAVVVLFVLGLVFWNPGRYQTVAQTHTSTNTTTR
jgi:succinate dehydrogenase hydrophobic anchor subunit